MDLVTHALPAKNRHQTMKPDIGVISRNTLSASTKEKDGLEIIIGIGKRFTIAVNARSNIILPMELTKHQEQ